MNSIYKIIFLSFAIFSVGLNVFGQKGFQIGMLTGYGIDLSIGENSNHYIFDLDGQNGGVDILNPIIIGTKIGYQFEHWGVSIGLSGTKRPLRYIVGTKDKIKSKIPLKVRYRVFETPIEVYYSHPILTNLQFRYSIGLSLAWSGKTDPLRFSKGYYVEDRWKADVLLIPDGVNELLVLSDEGEYLIGNAGVEVISPFGQNVNVGLSLNYHHQLGKEEITYFSLWGYDAKNDKRVNGYNPRRPVYKSLFFQINFYLHF